MNTAPSALTMAFREQGQILLSDLRYGARMLAKAPGFTTVTLLVIAVGIGATVSIFSLVNAVLLRSLPYGHPHELVYIWSPNRNFKGVPEQLGPNVPDFYEWQRLSHSFSSMTLFRRAPVNFVRNGSATRVGAVLVTGNFFRTLDVSPAMGRSLGSTDDRVGHDRLAVISDNFWRSELRATPHVIGTQIQLNRQTYTVVGVMPKDFGYPLAGDVPYETSEFKQSDIWLPAAFTADQKTDRANLTGADAIARLGPGVSLATAQAELRSIEARLDPLYPEMWRGWSVLLGPLVETIIGPVEKMLWLLLGAVGIVLLIAVTNTANLLLSRSTARAHELGIRTALGAERRRIVRQWLTESLMLSCLGGAIGIGLAYAAVHLLAYLNPGDIPRFDSATVDLRVLLVAVLLILGTGVLAGLAPAISSSRVAIADFLKTGRNRVSGGSNRSRCALIIAEVALSVVLLTGSVLMIRSYLALAAVDPGFSPATLTFRITLDDRYRTPEQRTTFYRSFLAKLKSMPGVKHAGASSGTPLSNHESVTFAEIQGWGRSKEMIENRSVTPEYRSALGTPLLRGRDFTLHDLNAKPPVVIVNQRFAALYFAGRDPIGGEIRIGIGNLSNTPWSTLVGVVSNIRQYDLEKESQPQLFQPLDNGDNFAVQCSAPVPTVIEQARAALRSLDPTLTLASIRTMRERVEESKARRNFQTTLLTGFAAIAIALALAGLYGLMSYAVKQRTAEIGVRLAVGSSRARILRLILLQGLRLAGFGLLVGMGGAFALARLVSAWLFAVKATDPVTFVIVPLFLLLVAAAACIIPAWIATRIDPIQALRQE